MTFLCFTCSSFYDFRGVSVSRHTRYLFKVLGHITLFAHQSASDVSCCSVCVSTCGSEMMHSRLVFLRRFFHFNLIFTTCIFVIQYYQVCINIRDSVLPRYLMFHSFVLQISVFIFEYRQVKDV